MTYHWIVPAPEFDSGAEKELNNISVAWASLPEQLSVHTAPTELYIFFCILFYKHIAPDGALD